MADIKAQARIVVISQIFLYHFLTGLDFMTGVDIKRSSVSKNKANINNRLVKLQ